MTPTTLIVAPLVLLASIIVWAMMENIWMVFWNPPMSDVLRRSDRLLKYTTVALPLAIVLITAWLIPEMLWALKGRYFFPPHECLSLPVLWPVRPL